MKTTIIWSVLFFFVNTMIQAQEKSFTVQISHDTVLIGNYLEVSFKVENASGNFEAPSFEGFNIVGGPNTSSNIQIINGEVSQHASYSYYLEPYELGNLYLGEAYFHTQDTSLETASVNIIVLENPDGIIQVPGTPLISTDKKKPTTKKKKRRKI